VRETMSNLLRGIAALMTIGMTATGAVAQSPDSVTGQTALLAKLQVGGTQATSALNTILRTPETTPAVLLFMASSAALKTKRLEDAGFLFYVAQMRHRFDVDAFPPKGAGGNDPRQLLQALSDTIGRAVNPTVMVQPKVFSRIVARTAQWEPKILTGSSPGWAHLTPAMTARAQAAHRVRKQESVQVMRGIATLISDPAYLQDFRLVQNYNLGPQTSRPTATEYGAARTRLANFERQKGIKGPFTLSSRTD